MASEQPAGWSKRPARLREAAPAEAGNTAGGLFQQAPVNHTDEA